jgi:predicted metal-dependent hydrolase
MDDEHEVSGTPAVRVAIRRTARARRLSLRVSRLDGSVTLSMPAHASRAEAVAFVDERADWIRQHLAAISPPEIVGPGSVLPVEGRRLRVVRAGHAGAPTGIDDARGEITVSARVRQPASAVAGCLKARARDRLTAASDRHAATLGRAYARITLRDPRSRWGSCSADGGLMFSWRLILAPPEVLDYVAAHEVAHLAEMNHSPRFWAAVEALCPGYRAPRAWLRREGAGLHRYRFAAAPASH